MTATPHPGPSSRRRFGGQLLRPPIRGAAVGFAVAAGLLLTFAAPAPASAYSPRTYEAQLRPPVVFSRLDLGGGIAIDSANRVWVSDFIGPKIYEFNSGDETLPLQIKTLGGSYTGVAIAADHENGYLYESSEGTARAYNSSGELVENNISASRVAIAVDNSAGPNAGRLYVAGFEAGQSNVESRSESGFSVAFKGSAPYIEGDKLTGTPGPHGEVVPFGDITGLAVDSAGDIIVGDQGATAAVVDEFSPEGLFLRQITDTPTGPLGRVGAVTADPTTGAILVVNRENEVVDEFSSSGAYLGQVTGAETPQGPFSAFSALSGIAVNSHGFLYVMDTREPNVANGDHGFIDVFSPSVILPKVTYPGVSAGAESTPTEGSLTLNANVNPDGGGEIKTCQFEYLEEAEYNPSAANPFAAAHTVPCSQALPYSGSEPTSVSATASGLAPGIPYRYRLLAGNETGTTEALPRTFELQAPSVALSSPTNLTETSADLHATINPQGGEVETCEFEYGPTTSYGFSEPCEPKAEDIGSVAAEQAIAAHLTGLEKGVVYHFRVVAKNPFGTTTTEDRSFNFLPPNCPNAHLRQQTGTEFLPDCRAYELVSPGDAGGTVLLAEGPQSPLATSPSRLAFGGILGAIPGAGGDPPDVRGDLYVSTRTDTGWVTRYVGLPGTQALQANGPPNQEPFIERLPAPACSPISAWTGSWTGPIQLTGTSRFPIRQPWLLRAISLELRGQLPRAPADRSRRSSLPRRTKRERAMRRRTGRKAGRRSKTVARVQPLLLFLALRYTVCLRRSTPAIGPRLRLRRRPADRHRLDRLQDARRSPHPGRRR